MQVALEAERAARARERQQAARRERRLGELTERLGALERRGNQAARFELPSVGAIRELVAAAHAVPFTDREPFELFDHPVAGRLQGFRRAGAVVGEEQAYRAFEDVFRGRRECVRELAAPYVELLRGHAPVLDAGCGRGELLELLREAGSRRAASTSTPGWPSRRARPGWTSPSAMRSSTRRVSRTARS